MICYAVLILEAESTGNGVRETKVECERESERERERDHSLAETIESKLQPVSLMPHHSSVICRRITMNPLGDGSLSTVITK